MIRWIVFGIVLVVVYHFVLAGSSTIYGYATYRAAYNKSSNTLDKCIALSKTPDFQETLTRCKAFSKGAALCRSSPEVSAGCITMLRDPAFQQTSNYCQNWSSQMKKCQSAVYDALSYGPLLEMADTQSMKGLSDAFGYSFSSMLGNLISFNGVKASEPWYKHLGALDKDTTDNIYIATLAHRSTELDFFRGVELARLQLNQQGGIRGHQIQILRNIDDGAPDWNRDRINSLIRDKRVIAVINRQNSEITKPLTMLFEGGGLLDVIVSASNINIILPNMQYNFRTHPDNTQLSKALASFCHDRHQKAIAMVTALDHYSKEVSHAFYNAALDVGIRVPYTKVFYNGQSDFTSILHDIKQKGVDAIFLAGTRDSSVDFVKQCRHSGINLPIYGSKTLENSDFVIRAGKSANGIIVPSIYNQSLPEQHHVEFVDAYHNKYGESPSTWAVQGYDALVMIAESAKIADSTEPLKMASAMRYKEIWVGAGGAFHFTEEGQVEGRQIFFKEIKDGGFVLVRDQQDNLQKPVSQATPIRDAPIVKAP